MKKTVLNDQELASFCLQISLLLHAGIPTIEAVEILKHDTQDESSRHILDVVVAGLEAGMKFHESVEAAGFFPEYMCKMIMIGELSGNLDDVMTSLAEYYEGQNRISSDLRTALTYPLIMVAMMMIVLFVLIGKVIPIFHEVFAQLGAEMTGISKTLYVVGNTMNRYASIFLIVLIVLILFGAFCAFAPAGKRMLRGFLLKMRFASGIYDKIACSRFAAGMSLTLASGLDTFSGLDMIRELVDDENMQKKIDAAREDMLGSANFAEALLNAEIFSATYSRMVAVGFKTGNLDQVFAKIAAYYQEEIDAKIRKMISVIEPTLVIVLSVVVGLILLSVILPLMGIMTSIG